jgi:colicin import membrane protein
VKLSTSEPGVIVSGAVHVALLAFTLVAFSDSRKFEDAQESVPVEMLTDQQFNQVMRGEKQAKPQEKPVVVAQRKAEVEEKKPPAEVEAKADVPTPPPPLKRIPDPGREDTPEPPKQVAALPPPEPPKPEPPKLEPPKPPVRPVEPPKVETPPEPPKREAEAIDPPKPPKVEPKKVEVTPPAPPTPPVKPRPAPKEEPKPKVEEKTPLDKVALAKLLDQKKTDDTPKPQSRPRSGDETSTTKTRFDSDAVSKLLSREPPGQRPSSARETSRVASLGSPTASAAKMSPSLWGQLDGLLQDQYKQCWSYLSLGEAQHYIPQIKVEYAADGSLVGQPSLLNPPSDPSLKPLAESALRAVRRCNPMKIPAQFMPYFEQWKARILRFDPAEMAG